MSRIAFPLMYPSANPTEGGTGNGVPVPPAPKCLPADMIRRHEAPVAAVFAVVAIVAHHEILAWRHAAGKAVVIVNAVFSSGKRLHPSQAHSGHFRDLRHTVGHAVDRLLETLRGHKGQTAFEVAVAAV